MNRNISDVLQLKNKQYYKKKLIKYFCYTYIVYVTNLQSVLVG